ncbi:hypothetical protein HDU83_008266 [Entophlyctis luteolus]|nr:hypothetical protein HDU83_008266 [Entophlyctis luteolus]
MATAHHRLLGAASPAHHPSPTKSLMALVIGADSLPRPLLPALPPLYLKNERSARDPACHNDDDDDDHDDDDDSFSDLRSAQSTMWFNAALQSSEELASETLPDLVSMDSIDGKGNAAGAETCRTSDFHHSASPSASAPTSSPPALLLADAIRVEFENDGLSPLFANTSIFEHSEYFMYDIPDPFADDEDGYEDFGSEDARLAVRFEDADSPLPAVFLPEQAVEVLEKTSENATVCSNDTVNRNSPDLDFSEKLHASIENDDGDASANSSSDVDFRNTGGGPVEYMVETLARHATTLAICAGVAVGCAFVFAKPASRRRRRVRIGSWLFR